MSIGKKNLGWILGKYEDGHGRYRQDQCARDPPGRTRLVAQPSPNGHDRGAQACQDAGEGNHECQQSARAAPQHVNGRCGHDEKERRYDGGDEYVAEERGHG